MSVKHTQCGGLDVGPKHNTVPVRTLTYARFIFGLSPFLRNPEKINEGPLRCSSKNPTERLSGEMPN